MDGDDGGEIRGGVVVKNHLFVAIEFRHFKDAHRQAPSVPPIVSHEPTLQAAPKTLQNLPPVHVL
jgi:hypothetical protein